MFHYVNEVVSEVLLGIAFWAVAGCLVVLGVWGLSGGILAGFVLGAVMGAAYFIHIGLTAETAVDMMEEKAAKTHTVSRYFMRLIVGAVIVYAAWRSGRINMPALLGGLFTLKAGVYSRTLVHRIFQHFGKHPDTVSEEALEGARRWAEEEAAERAKRKAEKMAENRREDDEPCGSGEFPAAADNDIKKEP